MSPHFENQSCTPVVTLSAVHPSAVETKVLWRSLLVQHGEVCRLVVHGHGDDHGLIGHGWQTGSASPAPYPERS